MAQHLPVEQVLNEFDRIAPFIYKLGNLTANPSISTPTRETLEKIIVSELQDNRHPLQIKLVLLPQQVEWITSIPNPVTLVDSETQTDKDNLIETDSGDKLKVGIEMKRC